MRAVREGCHRKVWSWSILGVVFEECPNPFSLMTPFADFEKKKNRRRVAATTTTTTRRNALFVNQSKRLPISPTIPLQYISGVKSQKWLPLLSYYFLISYLFIVELALILNMYDIFPATNFSLSDVCILYIVKLCGKNKWWNRPKLPFLQIIHLYTNNYEKNVWGFIEYIF